MDDTKIIDIILKGLKDVEPNDRLVNEQILVPNCIIISEQELNRIINKTIFKGLTKKPVGTTGSDRLQIDKEGSIIMDEFGSYSKYLRNQKKNKNFEKYKFLIPIGVAVVLFVFGIYIKLIGDKKAQQKEEGRKNMQLRHIQPLLLPYTNQNKSSVDTLKKK